MTSVEAYETPALPLSYTAAWWDSAEVYRAPRRACARGRQRVSNFRDAKTGLL